MHPFFIGYGSLVEKDVSKMTAFQNSLEQKLIEARRTLHRFPELSHEEYKTTERIRRWLEEAGIDILDTSLETGVVAQIAGKPGPVIALRADIDALPIQEEAEETFRSVHPGVMHACGHDFHTAVMLGAALLLKEQQEELEGTVKIIFQPAEETATGAQAVLQTGVLDDVQAIFGLHNDPHLALGELGTKPGILSAAVDRFRITITGKGAHAARPHLGTDPIIVGMDIIHRLQTLVSRQIPATESGVISVTQFHSGSTWNVIPETAFLEGTVRTFNKDVRSEIRKQMDLLVRYEAASHGAEAELDYQAGPPSVDNDPAWTEFLMEKAKSNGYKVTVLEPSAGGEDFSFYQEKIKGAFVRIGVEQEYGLHHARYTLQEAALLPAARYFAGIAPEALKRILSE